MIYYILAGYLFTQVCFALFFALVLLRAAGRAARRVASAQLNSRPTDPGRYSEYFAPVQ